MEEFYRFITTVRSGVIDVGGLITIGIILNHSKQNYRIKAKFSACINIKDSVYEENATNLGFL